LGGNNLLDQPNLSRSFIKEFDRLLAYKLMVSTVSLLPLGLVIYRLEVFQEVKRQSE